MTDQSFYPLSRDKFQELVAAPYGEAKKAIQKIDPLWGREPGEKISYRVTATAQLQGVAHVKASNQEEAEELADKLGEHDFDWGGYGCDDIEIHTVEIDER